MPTRELLKMLGLSGAMIATILAAIYMNVDGITEYIIIILSGIFCLVCLEKLWEGDRNHEV